MGLNFKCFNYLDPTTITEVIASNFSTTLQPKCETFF